MKLLLLGLPLAWLALAAPASAATVATLVDGSPAGGSYFFGGVTLASNGLVYGVASSGGAQDQGCLFAMKSTGENYHLLHDFRSVGGANPIQAPIEGRDGRLYGTASQGGARKGGVIYAIDLDGSAYTILHAFLPEKEGTNSAGRLLEAADGWLYGTNVAGGAHGQGTVFRIRRSGLGFSVLHAFVAATDGAQPFSGLTQAPDGKLYGATATGGPGGGGVLYAMQPDGTGFTVLKALANADGKAVSGSLLYLDGLLYGQASHGGEFDGGVIFRTTLHGEYSKLHDFSTLLPRSTQGHEPLGRLTLGSDGRLYGATHGGGAATRGTLFSIGRGGGDFQSLHGFAGAPAGAYPDETALVQIRPGVFLGTTLRGGAQDRGTIFSLEVPVPRPIVTISTRPPALVTTPRYRIRGRASAAGGFARVEYQLGRGAYRFAADTAHWSFFARLRPGRNVIHVRAVDLLGKISAPHKVVIHRAR